MIILSRFSVLSFCRNCQFHPFLRSATRISKGCKRGRVTRSLSLVSQMDSAVEAYRHFARFPQAVSSSVKCGTCNNNLVLDTAWTQRDLERAEKVKFSKTYCISCDQNNDITVLMGSAPRVMADEVWSKESPSGKYTAVVRKVVDNKKEERQYIEIWDGSCKVKNFDMKTKDKHGKIYDNDNYFGTFEWSHSEGHLLYVAEKKYPKTVSFFESPSSEESSMSGKPEPIKGDEHVIREEWGEGMVGKHWPVLCVLDIDTGDISVLDNVPDDVSPGLAVWAPDDTGVVFTGWCHEPYRLGLIYCIMRKSTLFYLELQTASCVALSSNERCSRYSVFSPDLKTFIYLDNAIGGPHIQCCRLLKFDWDKRTSSVVVDTVAQAPADQFQGLYCVGPPERCWTLDSKRVVINTAWRSQLVVLVINTETGQVTRLPSDTLGNMAALSLDKDVIVAQCSAPDIPHYLVAGKLPAAGQETSLKWCRLDGEVEHLDEIRWKIVQHKPTESRVNAKYAGLDYESVLLYPKEQTQKSPLVVFPHGGPHSVFTTDFLLYAALLCKQGLPVLMVNYRGSIGFGNDCIYSLPGHVGDQDVKDVQEAAEEVIRQEGYDTDRVVIWGGSHGGFLTCHLIGQYPGFYKAAVCRNPVINLVTMFGETDIQDWAMEEAGYKFEYSSVMSDEVNSAMWEKSPLRHVDKITTPTLIMLGLDDRRVNPKQGYELYKALKARNVPVRYIGYPDNGHPIVKVDSEADGFINIYRWFIEHLS